MPTSSSAYGRAYVLQPERSRALAVWWTGLHGLLAAAALAGPGPRGLTAFLLAVAVLHGVLRRPRAARPLLVYLAPGVWALPAAGRFELRLTAAAVGPGWARLSFGPGPAIVLLADQFDPEAWRRLRSAIGESIELVTRNGGPI